MTETATLAEVARVARESYGRLVALLAVRTRDIAAAEDALGDALAAALSTWPQAGLPDRPEAWLLTAARRRLLDAARAAGVRRAAAPTLVLTSRAVEEVGEGDAIPDRRLALMFACTHPAIAASIQAPLMLQVVLGIDAARIATAFLASPAAMGQALSRAKAKLRDAGIPFSEPAPEERAARVGAVRDAAYAALALGHDDALAGGALANEALWLVRVTAELLPEDAETQGLLALALHVEARRGARRAADGRYVPLDAQDPQRWNRAMILEAEQALYRAAPMRAPGRYQLEAAIQSAHAGRLFGHPAEPGMIALLYEALVAHAPSIGAQVGRAGALLAARGPEAALAALDGIAGAEAYQPWWAMRAEILSRLGHADAGAAYARAIALAEDPSVRAFLRRRQAGGSAPT
jgi:RNA polymerase sigma-70 factor (ECF subfamily)